ncbi:RICIN domain-containing protein [Rhodococcus marinonascens]|uniref:RICIN domain-containing protein n=1 Tax=Rhodococcus marinonascens TaxID=38311 RepID=UPI000A06C536|nr:RICIN domain-containing protein [Rhodococcus marinonascens]
MQPIRRWSTIAAATTLTTGTLLLPAGLASADDVAGAGSGDIVTKHVDFTVSCWSSNGRFAPFLNGNNDSINDWGVTVEAPKQVNSGEEFQYTMTLDPVQMRRKDPKGNDQGNDKRPNQTGIQLPDWIREKIDIAIPLGAELIDYRTSSDDVDITRVDYAGNPNDSGQLLRVWKDQVTEGTLKSPTGNGPNALTLPPEHHPRVTDDDFPTDPRAGLVSPATKKSKTQWPTITVTMRAGEAGTSIQPTLRTLIPTGDFVPAPIERSSIVAVPQEPLEVIDDAFSSNYGNPQNFFTFQTDWGTIDGTLDVNSDPYTNHSIRCAPRDTPDAATVNAGGMPLTTIPVAGAIYGLDGRVLDITDIPGSSTPNTQTWDYTGAANQQWITTSNSEIRNPDTNKCLDVVEDGFDAGGQKNGSRVVMKPCQGNPGQKWTLDPAVVDGSQPGGAITNQGSGKCLDVTDSKSENGVPVQVWDCTEGFNQQWNFA